MNIDGFELRVGYYYVVVPNANGAFSLDENTHYNPATSVVRATDIAYDAGVINPGDTFALVWTEFSGRINFRIYTAAVSNVTPNAVQY